MISLLSERKRKQATGEHGPAVTLDQRNLVALCTPALNRAKRIPGGKIAFQQGSFDEPEYRKYETK
jgi:hypothetical protein